MKVKIFKYDTNLADLESDINSFMLDKDVINVTQTQTDYGYTNGNRRLYLVITVLYK